MAEEFIGHVIEVTEKGGLKIETSIDGEKKTAWFGKGIVQEKNGKYFIPGDVVQKKEELGVKVRLSLPNYEKEISGNATTPSSPTRAKSENAKKTSMTKTMIACIRAAKKIVSSEFGDPTVFDISDFERADLTVRIAQGFFIEHNR